MSRQAVLAFREAVNGDQALQRELRSAEVGSGQDVTEFAAGHGYEFTVEELATVAQENVDSLTDFELEIVAGGRQGERILAADARVTGAQWVAPLQEESGSSC
jgi:predicted ribosomally synthesized peptide with nif11-like leader